MRSKTETARRRSVRSANIFSRARNACWRKFEIAGGDRLDRCLVPRGVRRRDSDDGSRVAAAAVGATACTLSEGVIANGSWVPAARRVHLGNWEHGWRKT